MNLHKITFYGREVLIKVIPETNTVYATMGGESGVIDTQAVCGQEDIFDPKFGMGLAAYRALIIDQRNIVDELIRELNSVFNAGRKGCHDALSDLIDDDPSIESIVKRNGFKATIDAMQMRNVQNYTDLMICTYEHYLDQLKKFYIRKYPGEKVVGTGSNNGE